MAQVAPVIPGTPVQGPAATPALTPAAPPPPRAAPEEGGPLQAAGEQIGPEYRPRGSEHGDFIFYPSMDLQEYYNSNIFVTETGTKSDLATFISPALSVVSDWSPDEGALNFLVNGQIRRYGTQVSENESNVSVDTNGKYIISHEASMYLTGDLGYQLNHEDRTSPDTVANQKVPTEYQEASAKLGFVRDAGILGFHLDSGADLYSYNNNVTATGVAVPETDRNRVEYTVTPRLTYAIVPGYGAFIQAPLNLREYQAKFDASGFQRSSRGYELDAGTTFQVTNLIDGQAYVGYLEQHYDDPRLAKAKGPSFGGSLLYNPTLQASVRLNVGRSVQETTLAPASSLIQTQVGLTGAYELFSSILLSAGFNYSDQSYQGLARDDHVYVGTLSGRYLINRNLWGTLSLNYQTRLSNVAPNSYHQESILAGVRLQY